MLNVALITLLAVLQPAAPQPGPAGQPCTAREMVGTWQFTGKSGAPGVATVETGGLSRRAQRHQRARRVERFAGRRFHDLTRAIHFVGLQSFKRQRPLQNRRQP